MNGTRFQLSLLAIPLLVALAAAQRPAARPAPGSPGVHLSRTQIAKVLHAAIAQHADPAVAAIGITDQYEIHEVHRGKAIGPPAIHHGWTELHFILSGGGILVTGGKIEVRPGVPHDVIVGGISQRVRKGDAIIIPPETPHWYTKVDGSLTYLEVRFATPPAPVR